MGLNKTVLTLFLITLQIFWTKVWCAVESTSAAITPELRVAGGQQQKNNEVRTVEVFENQIWVWDRGWIASDEASKVPNWSYYDGTKALPKNEITLPDDWEWTSEWTADGEGDSWQYGVPPAGRGRGPRGAAAAAGPPAPGAKSAAAAEPGSVQGTLWAATAPTAMPWARARMRRRQWVRTMAASASLAAPDDAPSFQEVVAAAAAAAAGSGGGGGDGGGGGVALGEQEGRGRPGAAVTLPAVPTPVEISDEEDSATAAAAGGKTVWWGKRRSWSVRRAVGWNFKGVGIGFKKPLQSKAIVVGLRVPLSRHFDKWDRQQYLPSVSLYVGGTMLGPTPTVSASVSFSFPLQFFFRPELLPFGVGQGLGAGRRATTVKRLGVTRSWLWTPDKGLRAAWSPWFFLLPGARAIFQFLRACLLWAVVIYDRIIHRRATRRGVGGSEGHPQRVSLKGRFPTLYRMRRWTGGKTSGVGYSFSWRPGMARPSSSAMLNFEPFFAGKKKRLKSEEIEMLEHDLLQESEDWRDQLRAKEEAEKSATTKHTEQQSGAWYEQHSVARSRVIQLGKEEEMNWPQQESGKSAPADPHDDYFVRRQDEFNQELASISDAVGSAEQYYSRHTWHKPEGETHHVDHWFNPMSRQRSRVEKWYTSHEHYIVNAALQSSEFVQNLASSGPASVIVARDEYDENRGEGYKT